MANDAVGQSLQGLFIALAESVGPGRENLENPHELSPIPEGNNEDGSNPEQAAGGGVDAGIGFGIVAALQRTNAQALGGESGIVETNTQVGRGAAGGGAADHFAVAGKSDGGAGGAGCKASLLHNLI